MRSLFPVVVCVLLAATAADAQEALARVERRQAGPYRLEIVLDAARPLATRPLRVTVRALDTTAALASVVITITGVPGPETRAVSTRAVRLRPSSDAAGGYSGAVSLSVLGAWDLEVKVTGAAGIGIARVPVAVSVPRVMPVWMGWMVGLSPLLGLAWFAVWQRHYLRRLRRAESPLLSAGGPSPGGARAIRSSTDL